MGVVDTATNIDICNRALDLIGSEPIVIDTASTNRTYCERAFAPSYKEILAAHFWNFASKITYAIQTTSPLFGFDNAFTKPSDCIRVWVVDDDPDVLFKSRGSTIVTDAGDSPADWATETDYIAGQYVSNDDISYICILAHTSGDEDDEPGTGAETATYWTSAGGDYKVLPVEYVYNQSDLSAWPEYAIQCEVYNLAIKIAPAIKQSPEVSKDLQALLYDPRFGHLSQARSFDAQESGPDQFTTNTLLKSRL